MDTISLCMIVRDEEPVLIRCLESAAGLYDELVIVDTGSADRTREIARGYTDKVYDFPWVDDFSAARNFAFERASMHYCMWLDADDVIPEDQRDRFLSVKENDLPVFEQASAWLDAYFAKAPLPALPPLAPQGSPFRQAVWRLLLEIPYGTVTTYGALARTLRGQGISAAAQAVGGAVGHNPISILIPCHRVVGSDGSLTGYAGGVANKQFLLELEGVDMTGLYVPTRGTAL